MCFDIRLKYEKWYKYTFKKARMSPLLDFKHKVGKVLLSNYNHTEVRSQNTAIRVEHGVMKPV